MPISSPGVGSNLDVNSIISQLIALEQRPILALNNKEASYQAQLSAYGTIKSAISSFQTSVRALSDLSKYRSYKASAADSTIVTASAATNATTGSYSIDITKLAQSQKLVTTGQASTITSIGNGTLTFDFGTISGGAFDSGTGKYTGATFTSNGAGTKTVTIDNTNNSLAGIRDAINKANIGVTASLVNDGGASPYRLSLSSNALGKANSVKISVTGDAALSNLLAHNPAGTQNLSETVTAQNAEFKVDGVSISKTSNSVSDVIQGVTLNLLKANSSTTLTVSRDTGTLTNAVNDFAKAYNTLNKTLTDLSSYNATTKQAAILQGDAALLSIQRQVRNTLNATLTGLTGSITNLPSIGVTFQKDGTLAVDSAKLTTAINNNFNDIAGLFAAVGIPSDSLITYTSSTDKTKPGTYAVNISQLATQGKTVGSDAAGLNITVDVNDKLNLTVDGISTSITLAANNYGNAAALATEVQSKINGASAFSSAGISVSVSESGGVITITSNKYGSVSNVSVTSGNGKDNLLGLTPTNTAGLDVAGTINNVAAAGSGQSLTGATGNDSEGLKLQITGGALGDRGTVRYSQGYAYKLDKLADSLLASNGPITSRTDGLNKSIEDITDQVEELNKRIEQTELRYRNQFAALDVLISRLTQTSSFLEQQLNNLPSITSSKK